MTYCSLRCNFSRYSVFLILFCAGFIMSPTGLQGITVQPMPLTEIVSHSGTIVHGMVTQVESGFDEKTGLICTWTTIKVIHDIKVGAYGNTPPSHSHTPQITYKQLGGKDKTTGKMFVSQQIVIKPGTEVVLCLYPTSALGFTSPVGYAQGVFYVQKEEKTGEKILDNGIPKSILFPKKSITLSTEEDQLSQLHKEKLVNAIKQCRTMKLEEFKKGLKKIIGSQLTNLTRFQKKKLKLHSSKSNTR